jgi:cation:H+ antiporter
MIQYLLFPIGLIMLIKGSDLFISSASRFAKRLGVSEFIIGLTLVSFATSIPEFANSVLSSIKGHSEISLGNIVGSSTLNLTLTLGLCAIIGTLTIGRNLLKRDILIMVASSGMLFLFLDNGMITRTEGMILVFTYFSYIMFILIKRKGYQSYDFHEFLNYSMHFGQIITLRKLLSAKTSGKMKRQSAVRMLKDTLFLVLGLGGILIGSNLVVDGAIDMASRFRISETIISICIIAVGTALPELSVSLHAAKKGLSNMAIGNLVGSNISNTLLILGTSAILRPLPIPSIVSRISVPAMVMVSILFLLFARNDRKITKTEGFLLIAAYVVFVLAILIYSAIFPSV